MSAVLLTLYASCSRSKGCGGVSTARAASEMRPIWATSELSVTTALTPSTFLCDFGRAKVRYYD